MRCGITLVVGDLDGEGITAIKISRRRVRPSTGCRVDRCRAIGWGGVDGKITAITQPIIVGGIEITRNEGIFSKGSIGVAGNNGGVVDWVYS